MLKRCDRHSSPCRNPRKAQFNGLDTSIASLMPNVILAFWNLMAPWMRKKSKAAMIAGVGVRRVRSTPNPKC
jgi:hypothetical protein